jgi:hypothetical protein
MKTLTNAAKTLAIWTTITVLGLVSVLGVVVILKMAAM